MSRMFTFAAAGALAACIGASAWSQNAQSGGAGTAGASGSAGVAGSGATGATGQAGAAGQAGAQVPNPSNTPGRAQPISPRPTGDNFDFNDPLRRPFFMDPGARQQLNMNDQQFNQLNQAYQQAWMRYQQRINRLGAGTNLTPQQRAQQMQQLQAQFNQQFGQAVDSTFTDPRLRTRFNQLDRQFRPFAAFNDNTVNQQLQMTPQQQREMRQLASRWRQQMQRLRRAGRNASDPQAANEQFAAMQAQYQQQMQQVMTPQQWEAWTQMNGEQYNFPQDAFFPQEDDNVGVAQRPGGLVPYNGANSVQNNDSSVQDNNTIQDDNTSAADRPGGLVPYSAPQNNTVR